MRIAMVGAGYVGLVSGACLADFGHEVACVDKDAAKIAALREGQAPIYEPGLSELVVANQRAGRLSFTTDVVEGMRGAQAAFIAVGNYDVLRDDGIAYGARLHRAGVPTRVVCYQKFAHAFLQDNTKYPEADRALDDFCAALRAGLAEKR